MFFQLNFFFLIKHKKTLYRYHHHHYHHRLGLLSAAKKMVTEIRLTRVLSHGSRRDQLLLVCLYLVCKRSHVVGGDFKMSRIAVLFFARSVIQSLIGHMGSESALPMDLHGRRSPERSRDALNVRAYAFASDC